MTNAMKNLLMAIFKESSVKDRTSTISSDSAEINMAVITMVQWMMMILTFLNSSESMLEEQNNRICDTKYTIPPNISLNINPEDKIRIISNILDVQTIAKRASEPLTIIRNEIKTSTREVRSTLKPSLPVPLEKYKLV
ncbi:hypothetical protein CHS0354_031957, partial [Potamilus streckersoni]